MKTRKLIITTLIITALLFTGCTGCGKKEQTETETETKTETEVVSTVSTTEPTVEPVLEPELEPIVYTLQDCFGEDVTVIDDTDALMAFINSYDGMTVRSYMTKRTYNDNTATDIDNSTLETVFSYVTYAGVLTSTLDGVETRTLKLYNVNGETLECVPFEDAFGEALTDDNTLSDVYKFIIAGAGLNTYFNDMFIGADTEVTEDEMKAALENGTYHVVSDIPKDAVVKIIEPNVVTNDIVMAQLSYDISVCDRNVDKDRDKDKENTVIDSDRFAFPSYVSGMAQYVNEDGLMTTVSLNVVLVPSAYADVEENVNVTCGCGLGCACGCDADPLNNYTFTDMDCTKYAKESVNVRTLPSTDGNKLGSLNQNDSVHVTGKCNETGWYRFEYDNSVAYCNGDYLVDNKVEVKASTSGGGNKPATAPNGNALDWSVPNTSMPGMPYSEAGIALETIIDAGDKICIYNPSFDGSANGFDIKIFGQLQKQAEDLWLSKGNGYGSWYLEKLPNGMCEWSYH